MSVPKLRFKGFNDEWVKHQIDQHIDFLSGYPFSGEDITEDENGIRLMRGINITEGYVRHNKEIDRYYLGEIKKLEKYVLSLHDLVIGMDGSKVGKNSALITKKDVGSLLVQRVARLRANKSTSIGFIYQHIISNRFHLYVDIVNTSSGIPHISAKQIKEFEIAFPSESEQRKIASFLTAVDDKISQLTQKCDLLTQYKKGVMQQIFSQELRFKNDAGRDFSAWNAKTIGDYVIAHKSGATLKPSDFEKHSDYEVIPKKAVCAGGFLELDYIEATFCSKNFFESNEKSVVDRHFLITTLRDLVPSGPSIGYIVKVRGDKRYLLAQGVYGIQIHGDLNEEFLIQYSNTDKYRVLMQTMMVGSTQVHIRSRDFFQTPILVPSFKEQTKIANFLSAIDAQISDAQAALDLTKEYKKGLLQQMFV